MTLWYVDNSLGTGSNNGTSWANAWHDFNVISWSGMAAGDTLYISGGSSSQTYSAFVLQPGVSGGSGNPITITAGIDAGHNGTVIIDGGTTTSIASSSAAVLISSGFTNLTIQNLTVQNGLENNIFIQAVASGVVIVQNCIVHQNTAAITLVTNASTSTSSNVLHFASVPAAIVSNSNNNGALIDLTNDAALAHPRYIATGSTSTTIVMDGNASATVNSGDSILVGYNGRGIRIVGNTGGTIRVQNCTFDTANDTPAQVDNFFTGVNGSTTTIYINNNTIICNNIDPSEHCDNIQIQADPATYYIYANHMSHPNGGVNNHGIIINDVPTTATYNIYNNTLNNWYNASFGAQAVPEYALFLENLDPGYGGTVNIYNNTIAGGSTSAVVFYEPTTSHTNWVLKNNIFYPSPTTNYTYYFATSGITASIDYNLSAPAATNFANINGTAYSFSGWQGQGYDLHGLSPANPDFIANPPTPNFALQAGSPAISAGTTLTIANPDIIGTTRPQGTNYDLGAYEFIVVAPGGGPFIGMPTYPDWIGPRY